MTSKRPE
jgi:18S rRNA (guanine1575-N7)-methyltransferase